MAPPVNEVSLSVAMLTTDEKFFSKFYYFIVPEKENKMHFLLIIEIWAFVYLESKVMERQLQPNPS